MFPAPENVALAGAPDPGGWGEEPGLHDSPLAHDCGGSAGAARHGEAAVHSWAS
jgi:hypothetical protein